MKKRTIKEIKAELYGLGIKQTTVAYDLSVTKDYLNQVLNERRKCSDRMFIKLNTYLNLKSKKK